MTHPPKKDESQIRTCGNPHRFNRQRQRCILPLTVDEVRRGDQVMEELRAGLERCGHDGFAPSLSALVTSDPADFLKLVERMALSGQSRWPVGPDGLELSPLRPGSPSARRKARLFDPAKHNALFAKAEHLMGRDGL